MPTYTIIQGNMGQVPLRDIKPELNFSERETGWLGMPGLAAGQGGPLARPAGIMTDI